MPASMFDALCDEVAELTRQPELALIQRRARRRRRTRTGAAAAAVTAVLVAGGLVGTQVGSGGQPVPAGSAPAASASPASTSDDGPVWWAGVGDATHLYTVLHSCGCLMGSDDAGRTWTVRQASWGLHGRPEVRGPHTLVIPRQGTTSPDKPDLGPLLPPQVSIDGGRTWAQLTESSTPAVTVPSGGWLICDDVPLGSVVIMNAACTPRAVDPVHHRTQPLVTPGGITIEGVASLPASVGLWLYGLDHNGKPTVLDSRDDGRTWSTHPVPVGEQSDGGFGPEMQLTTHDGQIADLIVSTGILANGPVRYGFESRDGGTTWRPTNDGAPLPAGLDVFDTGVTLPDGTHVIQQIAGEGIRALTGGAGPGGYTVLNNPHWPPKTVRVAVSDGSYLANSWRTIYLSSNGVDWTSLTPH